MANGFDLQQFATALQGAGAGLTGQLTPFLAQQERQRRTQVEESKLANQKARDSEKQRMITLFQDSQRGLELAKAGQWDRLANLASRREQLLATDFPETDSRDTQQFALVARAAAAGDPQAQQAALFKLQENTNIGLDTGILDKPKGVSAKEQAETAKINLQSEEIRQKLASGQQPSKDDVQKQVNVLRGSLRDNLKSFRQVEQANKRINAVGKNATAASDLALIFNFMKMLDPGSVVRESEFRTAAQARAFLSKAEGQGITLPAIVVQGLQRASTGASLLPEQRVDFLNQVDDLFAAARTSADTNIENILQQADQDQIKRKRVFGTKRLEEFTKRQTARQPQQRNVVVDF